MNRRRGTMLLVAGLLLLLAVLVLPAGAKSDKPLVMSFEMWAEGPCTYTGEVAGDVSGRLTGQRMCVLRSQYKSCDGVLFKWQVNEAGGKSFTAVTRGLCHEESGVMRLTGEITNGYMVGAKVTARGRLYDAQTGHYRGLITVYENLEVAEPLPGSPLPLKMYIE